MNSKSRGFTLIEVIISFAITAVILGVIGTFFITNSNLLSDAELKSSLQQEGENIQNQFISTCTQSIGITKISIGGSNTITELPSSGVMYSQLTASTDPDNPNSILLNELVVTNYSDATTPIQEEFKFKLDGNKLTMILPNLTGKVLSENVKSFRIKPLDATTAATIQTFDKTKGIEVNIVLQKDKGYSHVTYPISVIVKFRNFGVIP